MLSRGEDISWELVDGQGPEQVAVATDRLARLVAEHRRLPDGVLEPAMSAWYREVTAGLGHPPQPPREWGPQPKNLTDDALTAFGRAIAPAFATDAPYGSSYRAGVTCGEALALFAAALPTTDPAQRTADLAAARERTWSWHTIGGAAWWAALRFDERLAAIAGVAVREPSEIPKAGLRRDLATLDAAADADRARAADGARSPEQLALTLAKRRAAKGKP